MSIPLHETEYGRRFFGVQLSQLIKGINKLAGDKLYECEILSSEQRVKRLNLPERKRVLIATDFSKVVDLFNSFVSDSHLYIADKDFDKAMNSLSKRESFNGRFYHKRCDSGEIKKEFWFEISVKVKDIK